MCYSGIRLVIPGRDKRIIFMEEKVLEAEKKNTEELTYTIRSMEISDYSRVKELWLSIKGFCIRSLDDSKEGVEKFLLRNPGLSCVCEQKGVIIGAILCGHDGRRGCLYHVCVRKENRMHGIGKAMVTFCMKGLQKEGINKVSLIAFSTNDIGNAFWHEIGWTKREDLNYYDFVLNEENLFTFNQIQ